MSLLSSGRDGEKDRSRQRLEEKRALATSKAESIRALIQRLSSEEIKESHPELQVTHRQVSRLPHDVAQIFDPSFSLSLLRDERDVPGTEALPSERRERLRLYTDVRGKEVVVKKIGGLGGDRHFREARRLQRLRGCPGVVQLERVFQDREWWVQMPYYRSGSLEPWVGETRSRVRAARGIEGPEQLATEVAETFRQMVSAVASCHQRGIVHRDVKPGNFLRDDAGAILLTDFELSQDFSSSTLTFTATLLAGALRLTEKHASPELLSGGDAWKERPFACDIWALGITLAELVCGEEVWFNGFDGKVCLGPPGGTTSTSAALPLGMGIFAARKPSGPAWEDAVDLVCRMLCPAETRISASEALQHPFLAHHRGGRPRGAGAAPSADENFDGSLMLLNALLHGHRRQRPSGGPSRVALPGSEPSADVVRAVLKHFSEHVKTEEDLRREISFTMPRPQGGVEFVPLPTAMRLFFESLDVLCSQDAACGHHEGWKGVGGRRCAFLETRGALCPALPVQDEDLSEGGQGDLEAFGKVLAKCLLERVGVSMPLAAPVLDCLAASAGSELESARWDLGQALQGMAAFDRDVARRFDMVLAMEGSGDDALPWVTRGQLKYDGAKSERDDAALTSREVQSEALGALLHRLVDSRMAGLQAVNRGFSVLGPEILSLRHWMRPRMLQAVLSLAAVDTSSAELVGLLRLGPGLPTQHFEWLKDSVGRLTPAGRQVLITSVYGTAAPPPGKDGRWAPVEVSANAGSDVEIETSARRPRVTVPASTPTPEALRGRLLRALQLPDSVLTAEAEAGLSEEERRTVVNIMGGEIQPGGWVKHECGFLYAIGECGGAMQEGVCPKCGGTIGGSGHRIAAGNQYDGSFDGAAQPAWGAGFGAGGRQAERFAR